MKSVCIIGAGPSGIVCCKELVAKGFSCVVFEGQAGFGGAFAKAYSGFLFTTSTHLSAFSDFPEQKPSHHWSGAEFVAYCERYVKHFGLEECFMFNALVTRVARVQESGRFLVTVNNSTSTVFDFVVVASGLNHTPKDEQIHPLAIHSSSIRDFSPFKGKRVLIVGGGESGTDLSLLLMQNGAKAVCISVRSAETQVCFCFLVCVFFFFFSKKKKILGVDGRSHIRTKWNSKRCGYFLGRSSNASSCKGVLF
jgi:dimethylaniline monooxygenase (N-oxide forming)